MTTQFASGKFTIAECDVCGFRYKLKQLKPLIVKGVTTKVLACPDCWVPDHPQLHLGRDPVYDPQAVRDPRPDQSYAQSRDISWGWNPVGLPSDPTNPDNPTEGVGEIGDPDTGGTGGVSGSYLQAEGGAFIFLENGGYIDITVP